MLEEDRLDEEVKKKKRRFLVLLLVLPLLGAMVGLPAAGLLPTATPGTTEAVAEVPAPPATPTRPTLAPVSTPISPHLPQVDTTTAVPPETAPRNTATVEVGRVTLTATQETPGGAGGGLPDGSPVATVAVGHVTPTLTQQMPTGTGAVAQITPTSTEEVPGGVGAGTLVVSPTGTSTLATTHPTPPTPTPEGVDELPVAGAGPGGGAGRAILGLIFTLVATLMLGAGRAMRNAKLGQR